MSEHDDQPPGFPGDGNPWLPPAHEAADRVLAFVSEFGDGQVIYNGAGQTVEVPPLYARDLEALAVLIRTADPYWILEYRSSPDVAWTPWVRATGEDAAKVVLAEFREAKPAYRWRVMRCTDIKAVENW